MSDPRSSPKRPSSASLSPITISDNSDNGQPPRKRAKTDLSQRQSAAENPLHSTPIDLDTSTTETLSSSSTIGPDLSATGNSSSSAPIGSNQNPSTEMSGAFGPPSVPDAQSATGSVVDVDRQVEDVISCALEYFKQIRIDTNLAIDDNFRLLLQDPLPDEPKPFMVQPPTNVPAKLYEYFYILTFCTDRIFAPLCIWLDLCKSIAPFNAMQPLTTPVMNCDIYLPFAGLCDVQERLFRHGKHALGWQEGIPMHAQTAEVQHFVQGLMASTKLTEVWAKSPEGVRQRAEMELAAEGNITSDVTHVDRLLARVDYPSWQDAFGLQTGMWLHLVNQRHELNHWIVEERQVGDAAQTEN